MPPSPYRSIGAAGQRSTLGRVDRQPGARRLRSNCVKQLLRAGVDLHVLVDDAVASPHAETRGRGELLVAQTLTPELDQPRREVMSRQPARTFRLAPALRRAPWQRRSAFSGCTRCRENRLSVAKMWPNLTRETRKPRSRAAAPNGRTWDRTRDISRVKRRQRLRLAAAGCFQAVSEVLARPRFRLVSPAG